MHALALVLACFVYLNAANRVHPQSNQWQSQLSGCFDSLARHASAAFNAPTAQAVSPVSTPRSAACNRQWFKTMKRMAVDIEPRMVAANTGKEDLSEDEFFDVADGDAMTPDPVQIEDGNAWNADKAIAQHIKVITSRQKQEELYNTLEIINTDASKDALMIPKTVIFTQRQVGADYLADMLHHSGYAADSLHGGHDQARRIDVIDAFRDGRFQVLVATYVVALFLDVKDISAVINYDMPVGANAEEDYVNGIGCIARGNNAGVAYSFMTPEDSGIVRDLIGVLERAGQTVPQELRQMGKVAASRDDRKATSGPKVNGVGKRDIESAGPIEQDFFDSEEGSEGDEEDYKFFDAHYVSPTDDGSLELSEFLAALKSAEQAEEERVATKAEKLRESERRMQLFKDAMRVKIIKRKEAEKEKYAASHERMQRLSDIARQNRNSRDGAPAPRQRAAAVHMPSTNLIIQRKLATPSQKQAREERHAGSYSRMAEISDILRRRRESEGDGLASLKEGESD